MSFNPSGGLAPQAGDSADVSAMKLAQILYNAYGGGSAGSAPSGAAGGDLGGTYPNPTVLKLNGNALNSAGARTALGLGSIATQAASAVAITGGTFAGITGAGFRDTSAAFDVTQIFTSSTALSAARSITWDVKNTSHTLAFTAASVATFPAGTNTLLGSAVANTISVNGAASTPPLLLSGTWFTGGSATTTKPQFLVEVAGSTSTAWSTSGTGIGINAPSGFAGNYLDIQENGAERFKIEGDGPINVWAQGAACLRMSGSTLILWGSTFSMGLNNVLLETGTANILEQRSTTNAQTFQVYGTYTDASNYVRASLAASSTVVTLAAQTAGTGADNIPINITTAGTGLTDFTNQAASVDAAVVSTHSVRMKFGGTEYKIMLATP